MVTAKRTGCGLQIIARPNRSANWRSNMLVLGALTVPSLGAAVGFALQGAWPILPLAGLELTALGVALYCVNRRLQFRQVITVGPDTVAVAEGFATPRQHWHFHRRSTGLTIVTEDHPWEGPSLLLHDGGESVALGNFLGRDDVLHLFALLRGEIGVRGHSGRAEIAC